MWETTYESMKSASVVLLINVLFYMHIICVVKMVIKNLIIVYLPRHFVVVAVLEVIGCTHSLWPTKW